MINSLRAQARHGLRSVLYSSLRPRLRVVSRRVHNHLYNVSTDASTNGETWLIDRLPKTGVFLDVGFNEGEWSRAAARGGAGRTIHAFDPARSVIDRHHDFAPDGANFTFHPTALSNKERIATFHEYGALNGSSSLADRRAELGDDSASYDVKVTTLALWAEESGVSHIDVLKIDAEGSDLDIMEGARPLFDRRVIDLVVFEYASGWFSSGRTLMQAADFIESVGYDLYRLFPEFLVPYTYKVQHEGSAMAGYFVAISPAASDHGLTIRRLAM